MSYSPIAGAPIQYQKSDGTLASGYYLKFYVAGTTTPLSMGIDSTPTSTLAKCQINSSGYPINGSSAVFVPHVSQAYKIVLYKNSTDADADTTANADWVIDNLQQNASATPTQTIEIEEQLGSSASGQVFTLTSITYTLGNNNLAVYRNGQRLRAGVSADYEETSSTSITVNSSIAIGSTDNWVFVKGETTTSTVSDAASVTYTPAGSGAVATNVQAKLREYVSVTDFGAVGDGVTDDTAAIQAAIDTGLSVLFPEGTYAATGLTQSTNDQQFHAFGNVVITRNGGTLLLTSSGRNVSINNIKFLGTGGGAGNLVKCTGDIVSLNDCSSRTNSGHSLILEGNSCQIQGTNDIYYSAGVSSSADAAIAIGVTGTSTLYTSISAVKTSTSTYGIKYYDHGASAISDSQLGTVDMTEGAAYITNCRIVGDYIVTNSFNQLDNCTISGDVTLGDGASTPSGIRFGPGVGMQSGKTLTINKMRESYISVSNLGNGGVTFTDNLTGDAADIGNDIHFPPISWTPTWRGVTADPAIGNGTISGFYTRLGTKIRVSIYIDCGSTTTFGTGSWYFPTPAPVKTLAHGAAFSEDTGTSYVYGLAVAGFDFGDNIRVIDYSTGNQYAAAIPITWASTDEINISVEYVVDNT